MGKKEQEGEKRTLFGRAEGKRDASAGANAPAAPVRQPRQKAKILRWKGVLSGSEPMFRRMAFVVLVVTGATLTFTQLGFVDLKLPDGTFGYMVVLLQVVALGALLLGTLVGAVLGLVTGAVLCLHARFLPLDHYELTFVTPLTSIAMFAICGALLGILFAFALRNNPSRIRRVIYIIIVCVLVAGLYSLGFAINVFFSILVSVLEKAGPTASEAVAQQTAVSILYESGDLGLQLRSTALVMAILCIIGDIVADKVKARKGALGLRSVFGMWLAVVVGLTFMTMSAISFAAVSNDGLQDAEELMKDDVDYLSKQILISNDRADLLNEVFEQGEVNFDKVDEALLEETSNLFEDRLIVEDYADKEDRTVIVSIGEVIYASNNELFPENSIFEDVFPSNMVDAIKCSKESGEMQRCVYYSVKATSDALEDVREEGDLSFDMETQAYIIYVYAEDVPSGLVSGDGDFDFDQSIIVVESSDQVFSKRDSFMMAMTLSILALLLGVFLIVFQLLNRVVARRIDETNGILARVTAGDLDARVEVSDTLEFESLSAGINTTVDTLKGWIAEAESRMDAELATAKAIQESTLPRIFPPYPDIRRFDVYATMDAARQVGGDFYDFFLVGEDCGARGGKLAFVVADVSGKGVPAALFMMKAKALLQDYIASGMELGEAVEETNRLLADGNDEGMFVTAWVGVLDYGTGHVDYVNAGHNPPLLWQRDGGWRWLRKKSGPVLGLFEVPYRAHAIECKAGDTFLLYTDGVTEAFNVNEELYGEERLMEVAEQGYRLHPRELLESVRADVAAHSLGTEQSDDITILALEVGVPPEVTATLEVPAVRANLGRVNEFLHKELDRRLCPLRAQNQLDIAVEELFVNVCNYAYPEATPEAPGSVRIQRTYVADPPSIAVDIVDDGIPYNPLAKPDAVTPSNIEDVPIGGLGILMAKRSVDEMYYERSGTSNIVTIVKKW